VDRLNRSLTGLSAQACPRRSVSCSLFSRAASFSLLTGRFHSVGGLACKFFLIRSHPAGRAASLSFVQSNPLCRARNIFFFFLLTGHFLCWARRLFFLSACCRSAASVHAIFFLLCPVVSTRASNFFGGCLVSAMHANVRAPCSIFLVSVVL
jgi:hypothetical protein